MWMFKEERFMLKKTILATGLFAVAGGAVLIGLPAFAQAPAHDGHTIRDDSTRTRNSYAYHHHRNRNWNATSSEGINRIRLPITQTNTVNPVVVSSPRAEVTTVPALTG
jgi:hypothetical protein